MYFLAVRTAYRVSLMTSLDRSLTPFYDINIQNVQELTQPEAERKLGLNKVATNHLFSSQLFQRSFKSTMLLPVF